MTGISAMAAMAAWPEARLGEALEALAARHGLIAGAAEALPAPPAGAGAEWLEWAGERLGLEALPVSAGLGELAGLVATGGPALIRIAAEGAPLWLALTANGRLLGPDGALVAARADDLARLIAAPQLALVEPEVARVVDLAGVSGRRRARVIAAMVDQRVADITIEGIVLLRLPGHAAMPRQAAEAGLGRRLAAITLLLALVYGGEVWGWSILGGSALAGRLDWGWLAGWLLLTVTMVPLRLVAGWNEALFALDLGRLLKTRLLAGAMALPPDAVRRRGVGQLIGQVIEAQALEGVTLGGGFALLVGLIELVLAGWVLSRGASPMLHPVLLALFAAATGALALGLHRAVGRWTEQRLGLTDYLVEAMIGHRTRLAQERAGRRDPAEDGQLAAYHAESVRFDRAGLRIGPLLSSGWGLASLAALAPALAAGAAIVPLAVSLGGIMLAGRALGGIGGGLAALSRARIAWTSVGELLRAGGERPAPSALAPTGPDHTPSAGPRGAVVIEARDLAFAHDPRLPPVLDRASLTLNRGDRVLVEGPSGGGKSTLAAVLTGLRRPDAGLLLMGGLDRQTLGEDWHRRITSAPQFHENHVFSGTLAFNLLMGRRWPASDADLAEAEALCHDLGLGDLLRRMPGGLHQRVGETGWQLSHGERSRVFLARALLQQAEVTVLDESFASLDPATMERCLSVTLDRAETLVVIAHP